jgi:hypothetical protein
MSAEDIKLVVDTLSSLLVPDNTIRRNAEIKLEELQQNKPMLVFCLSNILLGKHLNNLENVNNQIKTYAAVVMRKLLQVKDTEIVNPVWKSMETNIKEQIKVNTLKALTLIEDKSLKLKVSQAATVICENVYEAEEEWQDILQYIVNSLKLELIEANILNIEMGLFLLSSIFGYVYDELSKGIDLYVEVFKNYFTSNILSLKTRTVQAITEILCIVRKKDSKKFKDFIISILETTYKCFEAGDEAHVNIYLTLA